MKDVKLIVSEYVSTEKKHNLITIRNIGPDRAYLSNKKENTNKVMGKPIDIGVEITYCKTCYPDAIFAVSEGKSDIKIRQMLVDSCELEPDKRLSYYFKEAIDNEIR